MSRGRPSEASRGRLAASGRLAAISVLAVSTLALAACAGSVRPGAEHPESVTRSINLSGFPPEFRRGFSDGCAAARAGQSGLQPKEEGQYRLGWHDGFDYCAPQKSK